MPDSAVYASVTETLQEGFKRFRSLGNPTEADIRHLVVSPVLDAIGYSSLYRRPEHGVGRNRPDEVCYAAASLGGHAALIVEAKPFSADFDRAAGGMRTDSPNRQIQRYLRQHPASGPATIGVLTDGIRWRVYERSGPASDISYIAEFNLSAVAEPNAASDPLFGAQESALQSFVDTLCRECVGERSASRPRRKAPPFERADRLFDLFRNAPADPPDTEAVLQRILGHTAIQPQRDIEASLRLEGKPQDAHDHDWEEYAFSYGPPLQAPQPSLEGEDIRLVVAAVRFASEPDAPSALSRADAALCARTFARAGGTGASILFAYCATGAADSNPRSAARLAVCAAGNVTMTAEFDPELPAPSARADIERALALLAERIPLSPERLLAPLEVAPLRQRFYEEVSEWTQRQANGKPRIVREAALRHLIRTMFAWILREKGDIPSALFEQAFAATTLANVDSYHADALRFLFHQRLNVAVDRRIPHASPEIERAMEEAPFLNGSLFQEQEGDLDLDIPADEYWRVGGDKPGLFTIFSRYHWTVDEHRPGESEQTLDPELLSNLFERLILPIESGEIEDGETLPRHPQGTYYTPADVASEMAKDALAAAVRRAAPDSIAEDALLALFGDRSAPLPAMTSSERERLASRVREVRIFDPAVGSGAFLFECLAALRIALEKLEPDRPDPTERIIRQQLFGQDIHPLAAHITRLRLYIALKAADRESGKSGPLPNLDAPIVCADTLETSADPNWRPDSTGQLDTADPKLREALLAVAENRARWLDAHSEEEKQDVLATDRDLRERLQELLKEIRALATEELLNFASAPILPPPSRPNAESSARADARLLFYEERWRGFDIVIGNPPYESLNKSMTPERKHRLAERKRYLTTNCGDLYTLFCEAALALAKPEGGVVTLIVPLSIAFGQAQRTLRRAFENRCASISLRHYDNIPDTAFNAMPVLKTWKNRQRTTMLTAATGAGSPVAVATTGLLRWPVADREAAIRQRAAQSLPQRKPDDARLSSQWQRIPSPDVLRLVEAMLTQQRNVASWLAPSGPELAFPETAGYFIALVPPGSAAPRREASLCIADHDARALVAAAANGHIGYGWWRIYGDGFDVNSHELTTLPIPDGWAADPAPAVALGRRLIAAIPDCITEKLNAGTVWRNVDFHTYAPELVAEADRLYIEALGLPLEPLLTHLKIMRSNRSWNFPTET